MSGDFRRTFLQKVGHPSAAGGVLASKSAAHSRQSLALPSDVRPGNSKGNDRQGFPGTLNQLASPGFQSSSCVAGRIRDMGFDGLAKYKGAALGKSWPTPAALV